ncbi:hypothetical protein RQP46_007776 [Phenoliferia psychrophenolica]
MARAANAKKAAGAGGVSQLKSNEKAMSIQCVTCKQVFMTTTKAAALTEHADSKHKKALLECFPGFVEVPSKKDLKEPKVQKP